MENSELIYKTEFNPKIKTYFFVLGCLIGLIPLIGWIFLVFWIFGLGLYWTKRQYNALDCQLNNKTLQFKKGVLFTVEKTIPLENIQDLTFKEGPILRFFGLSILEIETAGGQGNRAGGDLTLIGIIEAKAFREKVLAQRQLLKEESKSSTSQTSTSTLGDTALLQEISQTLKNIELELKKSKA